MNVPAVPDADVARPVARLMTVQQMEITINKIAGTELVPGHFRNRPEAILAAGLMGRELGWQLMTSLRSIYVIDGRPDLMTEAKQSLALQSGHAVEQVDAVTLMGHRAKDAQVLPGRTLLITSTVDEAEEDGTYGKGETGAYWMSVEQIADRLWPDVFTEEGEEDTPRNRLNAALRAGHMIEEVESATVRVTRGDRPLTKEITYTIEDAIRAGLIGRDSDGKLKSRSRSGKPKPWELHTKDMLYWRATSRVCRRYLADVYSRIETAAHVAMETAAFADPEVEADYEGEVVEDLELPASTGEEVPPCPKGPKGVHDLRRQPWCASCDYDPSGLRAAHEEAEAENLEAIKEAVRSTPCEDEHHSMQNRGPGFRPVCRKCGFDPSANGRRSEVVDAKVEAEAECDHSMGHEAGWCLGCGVAHPDYQSEELFAGAR